MVVQKLKKLLRLKKMSDNSDIINHFNVLLENGWEMSDIEHLIGTENFKIVLQEEFGMLLDAST